VKAPFSLGGWGKVVNTVGIVYGGAMIVKFAWPRVASNPTPLQTAPATPPRKPRAAPLLNFHIGFVNHIPVLYTVLAVVLILGILYYGLVQRNKKLPPVQVPAESGRP
jgi:hypothetical protein